MALAPRMRASTMSKGPSAPPRVGSAVAREMTMNAVQMSTVTAAASKPVARGENDLNRGMARLSALPAHARR